jgi:hypothetical protein
VTNGESTARTLRATSLGGDVLSWDDVLHEGPVPAVPPDELRRVRADYLAACGWGRAGEIAAELERRDRRLAEADDVVLWFEHDLYDQLQLIQILAQAPAPGRLQLINVGSFPGRPDFHGLGELDASELETLWPLRRPVSPEQVELARRAWDAFRAPGLAPLRGDTSALPFLGAAWERLLEELPDAFGLSRSERRLLEPLAAGPRTAHELFLESQAAEDAPYLGDSWAWKRLADLGGLVASANGAPLPAPPPRGDADTFNRARVALTDAGRAVLAGEASRTDHVRLDRWLGGTHLQG